MFSCSGRSPFCVGGVFPLIPVSSLSGAGTRAPVSQDFWAIAEIAGFGKGSREMAVGRSLALASPDKSLIGLRIDLPANQRQFATDDFYR
jgi:hypothetical protein